MRRVDTDLTNLCAGDTPRHMQPAFVAAFMIGRSDHRASLVGLAHRSQLELAIVEYLGWFNDARLHESLGDLTPTEFEALYATPVKPSIETQVII